LPVNTCEFLKTHSPMSKHIHVWQYVFSGTFFNIESWTCINDEYVLEDLEIGSL
jgi:hypothetical protein